jgi:hypothetical protein
MTSGAGGKCENWGIKPLQLGFLVSHRLSPHHNLPSHINPLLVHPSNPIKLIHFASDLLIPVFLLSPLPNPRSFRTSMSSHFTALKRLDDPHYVFGSQISSHFSRHEPGAISLGLSYKPRFEQLRDDDDLPNRYSSVRAQEQSDIVDEIADNPCFSLYSNQPSALHDPKARAIVDDLVQSSHQSRTAGELRKKVSQVVKRTTAGNLFADPDPRLMVFDSKHADDLVKNQDAVNMADRNSAHSLSVAAMLGKKPAIGMSVDEGTVKVFSNRHPSDLSEPRNRNVCFELSAMEEGPRRTSDEKEIQECVDEAVKTANRYKDAYSYNTLTKEDGREFAIGPYDIWSLKPEDWQGPLAWD